MLVPWVEIFAFAMLVLNKASVPEDDSTEGSLEELDSAGVSVELELVIASDLP